MKNLADKFEERTGLGERVWRASPLERTHGALVIIAMVATVLIQQGLWNWFIEDAAISFAYARHWASGEGLVAFAGGERVEGYSNPTWVFLLTLFECVGINGFSSAKFMSGIFAALTVPFVYLIAAAGRERGSAVPIIAVGALVVNSQFNIWNVSGLENSLFNLLLAAAMWRTLVDPIRAKWPLSAALFFALAITRPEAILYAAFGGAFFLVASVINGRGLAPTGRWLAIFFIPFGLYHLVRYNYFGWLFPNTYYAKMGDDTPHPLGYNFRGWKYLRRYASYNGKDNEPGLAIAYILPLFGLAAFGTRGIRAKLGGAVIIIVTLLLVFPLSDDLSGIISSSWAGHTFTTPDPGEWLHNAGILNESASWVKARAGIIWASTLVTFILALGRPRGGAAVLAFGMTVISLLFAVWANGDWMKGYRWLSLCSVPMSVLFALGIGALGDAIGQLTRPRMFGRWGLTGWSTALSICLLFGAAQVRHANWFHQRRETGPQAVHKRVKYMNGARARMHVEHATGMDVDMGAHMWWSGWDLVDMAGLVDVPIAHHNYEKPFMREYIFDERRPELPHVHGAWAKQTKIPQHPEWKREYIEIPGFPAGPKALHIGNHVRRDLLMSTSLPDWANEPIEFGPITLYGPHLPFTTAENGGVVYLELALKTSDLRKSPDFSLVVFLFNDAGIIKSWDVAPGYDWLEPKEWRRNEHFIGKYALPLPKDLDSSRHSLGLAIIDRDGNVIQANEPAPQPHFVAGEAQFIDVVEFTPTQAIKNEAVELVNQAEQHALADHCDDAAQTWQRARERMSNDEPWLAIRRPRVAQAVSNCLARQSTGTTNQDKKIEFLSAAKEWDHWAPEFLRIRTPVVQALIRQAVRAHEAKSWEDAYRLNSQILSLDAQRPFARKRAEEARDYRLKIDPESVIQKARDREIRREEAKERQRERNHKKRKEGLERKRDGTALPKEATPTHLIED